jgi:hypothetical protein
MGSRCRSGPRDLVRDGLEQSVAKGDRSRPIGFREESGKGDFRGAIDGDEQVEFAPCVCRSDRS